MTAIHQIESSEQLPAQPTYVLRGHSAQIHAVQFLRGNSRLLTGDADGFVVLWSVSIKRPVAVWKAHSTTILGLGSWGSTKIITHGRDGKICVWQLKVEEEATFSTTLPIEDASGHRQAPWLLHTLPVNTLNFCSFAMVPTLPDSNSNSPSESILVGTPGVKDGHVNIISLPDEERVATIPSPQGINTGMLMAIGLCFLMSGSTKILTAMTGYESGHVAVYQRQDVTRQWQLLYLEKTHSQPVLSLCLALRSDTFFSSSADALIARHPLGKFDVPAKYVQTKHAGQQGLTVRLDEKIFATAGWDSRVRVYSVKSMKELAVLKWHKEGCYALAFADVGPTALIESWNDLDKSDEATNSRVVERGELTVAERREEVARTMHWLAVGSKDGKVSLWHIY